MVQNATVKSKKHAGTLIALRARPNPDSDEDPDPERKKETKDPECLWITSLLICSRKQRRSRGSIKKRAKYWDLDGFY
jgi:hypothetical protein